jgi:hypothetical protein
MIEGEVNLAKGFGLESGEVEEKGIWQEFGCEKVLDRIEGEGMRDIP